VPRNAVARGSVSSIRIGAASPGSRTTEARDDRGKR
jgi:hypothetical protein